MSKLPTPYLSDDNLTDKEKIEMFINGYDPQERIYAIESYYGQNKVDLFIDDPDTGKRVETHTFTPFAFIKNFKEESKPLYSPTESGKLMKYYGLNVIPLRTDKDPRLEAGFKYIMETSKSPDEITKFFTKAGVNPYKSDLINILKSEEQFFISTGKRLFKGYKKYSDVHKFYFDIETTSLEASRGRIFMIGMKDNRGFEKVLSIDKNNLDETEGEMIKELFQTIIELKPSVVGGYNSENFDFTYIFERAEILGLMTYDERGNPDFDFKTSIHPAGEHPIKRGKSTIKFGGETENSLRTIMWGINVIDICHAVRKAQAINSEIKSWSLKYITQFADKAKPNRMYVQGNKIYDIWEKNKNYLINTVNNDYKIIPEEYQDKKDEYIKKVKSAIGKNKAISDFFHNDEKNVKLITGIEIINQYLLDDLWETEQVDEVYNQASYMMAANIPTSYARVSTMGSATTWKLLMTAYSYEAKIAIPKAMKKKDIVGGLSRLFNVGYVENILKMDFASLYPSIQLTHDVFPTCDITGVFRKLLTYFRDARLYYKDMAGQAKKVGDKELETLADTKQLPIKIFINTLFGGLSSPEIFPWGDNLVGERITCIGRQYLRQMVYFFMSKGFKPLLGDSVTHDTPVYLKNRDNNYLEILPICDLFDENSEELDEEKLRDFSYKNYDILTRNGWKTIKYVYRHETDKKIHQLVTKDRLISVTEDHSLFQDGKEVKPSGLRRGDKLDIYNVSKFNSDVTISEDKAFLYGFFLGDGSAINSPRLSSYKSRKTGLRTMCKGGIRSDWKISNSRIELLERLQKIMKLEFNLDAKIKNHIKSSGVYNLVLTNQEYTDFFCKNFYTSYREKKIPSFILNSSTNIKKAFLEGVCHSDGYGDTIDTCISIGMKSQVAMAGIGYLLQELNIEYKIHIRKDKESFITLILKNSWKSKSIDKYIIGDFGSKSRKQTDEIWHNKEIRNKDKNNYVYDVSTEDGTFICGIGGIIAHNTDGINYGMPENVDELRFIDKNGNETSGYNAVLTEYNEKYMTGVMNLDEDGVWLKSINFARKNYVNLTWDKKKNVEKMKLTGASIKSKKIPTYIEEFLDDALRHLLNNEGKLFIELYHKFIEDIYNGDIPLSKIAQKAKVKMSVQAYKSRANMTNINGNALPKQAHMELIIEQGLNVNLGDVVYYVNNGKKKADGDIGNSYLIFEKDFINDPNLKGEYNTARSLVVFNKKVEPLLVGFNPEIRSKILISNPKDKQLFTVNELKLGSGNPLRVQDQDCINIDEYISPEISKDCHKNEPLFEMSEREIIFWNKVGMDPKEIFSNFTTELSSVKLNVEDVKIKVDKIIKFFNDEGINLKWMLEKYTIDDLVLAYDYDEDKWSITQSIKGELVEKEQLDISKILNLV